MIRIFLVRLIMVGFIVSVSLFLFSAYLVADVLGYFHVDTNYDKITDYSYLQITYNAYETSRGDCVSARDGVSRINAYGLRVGVSTHVYAAYRDVRHVDEQLYNGSMVRLVAIGETGGSSSSTTSTKGGDNLFCVGYYGDNNMGGFLQRTVAWSSVVETRYEMAEQQHRQHVGLILSCQVPLTSTPRACYMGISPVSLAVGDNVSNADVIFLSDVAFSDQASKGARIPTSTIPAEKENKPKNNSKQSVGKTDFIDSKRNLDVCVQPLFGNRLTTRVLIEFIELLIIQGVDKIHFYNAGVSSDLLAVIKYYQVSYALSIHILITKILYTQYIFL